MSSTGAMISTLLIAVGGTRQVVDLRPTAVFSTQVMYTLVAAILSLRWSLLRVLTATIISMDTIMDTVTTISHHFTVLCMVDISMMPMLILVMQETTWDM